MSDYKPPVIKTRLVSRRSELVLTVPLEVENLQEFRATLERMLDKCGFVTDHAEDSDRPCDFFED